MKLSTTAALRAAAAHVASSVEMRLLERLFDHTSDLAFFIKDAAGGSVAENNSLVSATACGTHRRCSVACIPAEQDANVLHTAKLTSSASNSNGIRRTSAEDPRHEANERGGGQRRLALSIALGG